MSTKSGVHKPGIKFTALVVAFVFTLTSVTCNTFAHAAPAEAAVLPLRSTDKLAIPEEMGSVSFAYRGTSHSGLGTRSGSSLDESRGTSPEPRFVVLIQDAHAVVDAQENIAKILGHLRESYGINQAALEGAKGRLEPILLRTFPEPNVRRKILAGYEKRAELTGPEMAAVLQDEPGEYRGMEDWGLYEQNYAAYLQAQEKKPALLSRWSDLKKTLDIERTEIYDAKLNEFQEARENFLSERTSLLDLLVYLSEFKGLFEVRHPEAVRKAEGSQTGILRSGLPAGRLAQNDESVGYQELPGLISSIGYEKNGKAEALVPLVRSIADEFKTKYLRGLGVKTEMNFYNRYQAFMTGKITAGQMLQYLVQVGRENGKAVHLTPALKKLLGHAELLSEIKGSRLYDELRRFLPEVEASLLKTPAQRALADKYRRLYILKDLINLELTHEQLGEWTEFENRNKKDESISNDKNSKGTNGEASDLENSSFEIVSDFGLRDSNFDEMLQPATNFYRAALERDLAFYQNIVKMMEKQTADGGPSTIAVVAGGFHTEGLQRLLEANQIHYAVVTPKIVSLAGSQNYAKVMNGEVSFKDYLKTTYFDGLMRHASKAFVEALPIPDRVRTLKAWRDNVIRELSKEGRITDAGKFLPYIDELLQNYPGSAAVISPKRAEEEILGSVRKELAKFKKDSFARLWKTFEFQLDAFTDGLKQLIAKKDLSAQSVSALLEGASQTKPSFLCQQRALGIDNGRAVSGMFGDKYGVRDTAKTERQPVLPARESGSLARKPGSEKGSVPVPPALPKVAAEGPRDNFRQESRAEVETLIRELKDPAKWKQVTASLDDMKLTIQEKRIALMALGIPIDRVDINLHGRFSLIPLKEIGRRIEKLQTPDPVSGYLGIRSPASYPILLALTPETVIDRIAQLKIPQEGFDGIKHPEAYPPMLFHSPGVIIARVIELKKPDPRYDFNGIKKPETKLSILDSDPVKIKEHARDLKRADPKYRFSGIPAIESYAGLLADIPERIKEKVLSLKTPDAMPAGDGVRFEGVPNAELYPLLLEGDVEGTKANIRAIKRSAILSLPDPEREPMLADKSLAMLEDHARTLSDAGRADVYHKHPLLLFPNPATVLANLLLLEQHKIDTTKYWTLLQASTDKLNSNIQFCLRLGVSPKQAVGLLGYNPLTLELNTELLSQLGIQAFRDGKISEHLKQSTASLIRKVRSGEIVSSLDPDSVEKIVTGIESRAIQSTRKTAPRAESRTSEVKQGSVTSERGFEAARPEKIDAPIASSPPSKTRAGKAIRATVKHGILTGIALATLGLSLWGGALYLTRTTVAKLMRETAIAGAPRTYMAYVMHDNAENMLAFLPKIAAAYEKYAKGNPSPQFVYIEESYSPPQGLYSYIKTHKQGTAWSDVRSSEALLALPLPRLKEIYEDYMAFLRTPEGMEETLQMSELTPVMIEAMKARFPNFVWLAEEIPVEIWAEIVKVVDEPWNQDPGYVLNSLNRTGKGLNGEWYKRLTDTLRKWRSLQRQRDIAFSKWLALIRNKYPDAFLAIIRGSRHKLNNDLFAEGSEGFQINELQIPTVEEQVYQKIQASEPVSEKELAAFLVEVKLQGVLASLLNDLKENYDVFTDGITPALEGKPRQELERILIGGFRAEKIRANELEKKKEALIAAARSLVQLTGSQDEPPAEATAAYAKAEGEYWRAYLDAKSVWLRVAHDSELLGGRVFRRSLNRQQAIQMRNRDNLLMRLDSSVMIALRMLRPELRAESRVEVEDAPGVVDLAKMTKSVIDFFPQDIQSTSLEPIRIERGSNHLPLNPVELTGDREARLGQDFGMAEARGYSQLWDAWLKVAIYEILQNAKESSYRAPGLLKLIFQNLAGIGGIAILGPLVLLSILGVAIFQRIIGRDLLGGLQAREGPILLFIFKVLTFFSKTPSVTVSTYEQGDRGIIEIRDRGQGIPASTLDAFKKFQKGSFRRVSSTKDDMTGFRGNGLALAFQAASFLGGEMSIQSATEGKDRGTTVTFSFPLSGKRSEILEDSTVSLTDADGRVPSVSFEPTVRREMREIQRGDPAWDMTVEIQNKLDRLDDALGAVKALLVRMDGSGISPADKALYRENAKRETSRAQDSVSAVRMKDKEVVRIAGDSNSQEPLIAFYEQQFAGVAAVLTLEQAKQDLAMIEEALGNGKLDEVRRIIKKGPTVLIDRLDGVSNNIREGKIPEAVAKELQPKVDDLLERFGTAVERLNDLSLQARSARPYVKSQRPEMRNIFPLDVSWSEGDMSAINKFLETGNMDPAERREFKVGKQKIEETLRNLGFDDLNLAKNAPGYLDASMLRTDGAEPTEADQIRVAIGELVSNVDKYVVGKVPEWAPDEVLRRRAVYLGREITGIDGVKGIEIVVADNGSGFPKEALLLGGYTSEGGGNGFPLVVRIATDNGLGFLEVHARSDDDWVKTTFDAEHPKGIPGITSFRGGTLMRLVIFPRRAEMRLVDAPILELTMGNEDLSQAVLGILRGRSGNVGAAREFLIRQARAGIAREETEFDRRAGELMKQFTVDELPQLLVKLFGRYGMTGAFAAGISGPMTVSAVGSVAEEGALVQYDQEGLAALEQQLKTANAVLLPKVSGVPVSVLVNHSDREGAVVLEAIRPLALRQLAVLYDGGGLGQAYRTIAKWFTPLNYHGKNLIKLASNVVSKDGRELWLWLSTRNLGLGDPEARLGTFGFNSNLDAPELMDPSAQRVANLLTQHVILKYLSLSRSEQRAIALRPVLLKNYLGDMPGRSFLDFGEFGFSISVPVFVAAYQARQSIDQAA